MPVIANGNINPDSILAPNVYVQIQPPEQVVAQGLPTNIINYVGTSSFGPVDVPVPCGSLAEYNQLFGPVLTDETDLGTAIAVAAQKFVNTFIVVRVTDGTDTASTVNIVDISSGYPVPGLSITSKYTGAYGNNIDVVVGVGSNSSTAAPTYKISVSLPNQIPETFDNIGGTGNTLWSNMAAAINSGQGSQAGPSQLVNATLLTGIGAVTVSNAGTAYTSIPTVGFTGGGGTGATAVAIMKALVAAVAAGGTGYAVNDTIVLAGGTSAQPITLTVATVSTGVITGVTITTAGKYSALPSNPISQSSTSGSGTGATFNITGWGVDSVNVTASGSAYTSAPTVGFTGGAGSGAAATALIGAQLAPAQSTYNLSGGTSGNDAITSNIMIGTDGLTRTGMYALRNTGIGVCALVALTDPTTFAAQTTFGLEEGKYMQGCGPLGQSLSQAIAIKQAFDSPSYAFKYLIGDWESWADTANNVTRYVSPQFAECSLLSSLLPNQSGLNKEITSIAGTQSTVTNTVYSQGDIALMMLNGIDVIAAPSPGGNYFAPQTGKNTSANLLTSDDSYSRLTPFIAYSLNAVCGTFVGDLQTPEVRKQAQNTLVTFLTNLAQQGMIGDVNGGKAFSVVLDATNNPDNQVALGVMQADVRIVTFKVIYVFLINLQNGDVSLGSAIANTPQNRRRLIR
jgi:hypothetical protein